MNTGHTDGPFHASTPGPTLTQRMASAQESAAVRAHAPLTVRYTVYFELTSHATMRETEQHIKTFFLNLSLSPVVGYSDGLRETSIVVDIIGTPDDRHNVLALAHVLKNLHRQSSVLVTWSSVSSILV